MAAPSIVQSLWIGPRLSAMERLCINSFLKAGHEFHLYAYGWVEDVPVGTIVKDANDIIPANEIFSVRGGFSSFSDFFRWKLVLDKGGWWVDTDTVCLRPFVFGGDYTFVGGLGKPGSGDCVSSGMFSAPAGSPIMRWGWDQCQGINPATMSWGQAGPPLFTEAVHKFGLTGSILPGAMFFPVYYTEAPEAFTSEFVPMIPSECWSIHLFNEMWRLKEMDKDATYPSDCLYEQLKRRFL